MCAAQWGGHPLLPCRRPRRVAVWMGRVSAPRTLGSPLGEVGWGPCSATAGALPDPRHATCCPEPCVLIFENGASQGPGGCSSGDPALTPQVRT